MNILAIIPARGGSKGIPRKNLTLLNGKTLVEHSVQHARDSKLINRVFVSSDSDEILEAGKRAGAEAHFKRPVELAGDQVLDLPVFKHVLDELAARENYMPDLVVHLRPTAPFRKPGWIDECIRLLMDHPEADSVRSVSEPEKHPYRMFTIADSGYLDPIMKHLHPEPYLLRRQDLPNVYFYNCVIDVTRRTTIQGMNSMTGKNILPFIMDPDDVYDIDTPRDLEITRYFFEKKS
jgi:CMP-N,N'-diacetyllegionaminic acid synthase